jgi:hypothetical protein
MRFCTPDEGGSCTEGGGGNVCGPLQDPELKDILVGGVWKCGMSCVGTNMTSALCANCK